MPITALRSIRKIISVVLLALGACFATADAQPMEPFALADQTGARRGLQDIAGPSGAVLVFYRSTTWCPYCRAILIEMQRSLPDFTRAGLGVAAISPDSSEQLKAFARQHAIGYSLLADSGSKLIASLGILDKSIPADSDYRGIPYPCVFVVDRNGTILGKYFEEDRRQRFTPEDILRLRSGRIVSTREVTAETKYATLSLTMDRSIALAGARIALDLNLTARPGIRIQGVDFKITEGAAFAERQIHYPAKDLSSSDHLHLKGYVKLADRPELESASKRDGELPLNTTLRFQACEGQACFDSEEVPLQLILRFPNSTRP